jgi:hypothetical protein
MVVVESLTQTKPPGPLNTTTGCVVKGRPPVPPTGCWVTVIVVLSPTPHAVLEVVVQVARIRAVSTVVAQRRARRDRVVRGREWRRGVWRRF